MSYHEYQEHEQASINERVANSDPREQASSVNEHVVNNDPREQVRGTGYEYPAHAKLQMEPRRRAPWRIVIVCVIALFIAAGIVMLTGGISIGAASQSLPTRAFRLSGDGSLMVDEGSGSVHVHTGNTNQIIVTGTKHAPWGVGNLNDLQVQYVQQGNTLKITTSESDGIFLFNNRWVDLDITVPASMDLTVQGGSTDVNVSGVDGRIETHISSGDVTLDNVSGSLDLNNSSGDITVKNESGPLDAHTSSGDIKVDHAAKTMDLSTDSGDITVDHAELSGQDSFQTVSGDIDFTGTLDPGGTYQMKTTSGDITLTLPTNSSFQLNASTNNGDIHNAFPTSTVGIAPTFSVILKTTSGDITVQKDNS